MPDVNALVTLVTLSVGVFISTNLDDIFILLGFFSDPKFTPRQIAIGQLLGIGALFAASVVASLLALVVAPAYVGLLGVLPIGIGLKKLWELWRDDDSDDESSEHPGGARWNALAVAAVTIADGGDNLGVYIPVFATRSGFEVAIMGVVFTLMTMVWLGAAFWLTSHKTLGAPIREHGHRVVPFVLVGIGGFILYSAGTLALVRSWL
jgi:cadmium resistance protein CadD (predicted permease)